MNKLLTIIVLLFGLSSPGFTDTLPEDHPVNGGMAVIPIDIKQQPEAYFQGNRIPVLPSPQKNQWLLVVAIPLTTNEPIQYIDLTTPIKARIPFHVSDKYYNTQFLTIKDLTKVDPQAADQLRIANETKKLTQIYSHYSNSNPFQSSFAAPIRGPVSSLFGLKRFYNKQPRDPHSGIDIAAKEGDPVKSVSQGVVAETGDYFFTGSTVIIDHGMGVFSLYAHLSKILVQTGQSIQQGQEIGLVGMTGRVTGPHLHWSMIVNQTLVEPLLFVAFRNIATTPVAPAAKTIQSAADVKS